MGACRQGAAGGVWRRIRLARHTRPARRGIWKFCPRPGSVSDCVGARNSLRLAATLEILVGGQCGYLRHRLRCVRAQRGIHDHCFPDGRRLKYPGRHVAEFHLPWFAAFVCPRDASGIARAELHHDTSPGEISYPRGVLDGRGTFSGSAISCLDLVADAYVR